MADDRGKLGILGELRRRNVFRVAFVYAIAGWLILQVADVLFGLLGVPDWSLRLVFGLLLLGFPLAVIFSWVYEMTPEGLKREKEVDRSQSITTYTGSKIDRVIAGLLLLAIAGFALTHDWGGRDSAGTRVAGKTDETAPALESRRSLAVLPFANLSNDPENEPFAAGIHDDLLTHLSKIRSLKIISRTSVLQYKGTTRTIPDIASELGVSTVLEGGVQRAGDQLRINVQLIDAGNDEHLWAETYNRKLSAENIFAIQSEISAAIADALAATLSPEERSRLAAMPTANLEAYNAYLLGRQRLSGPTIVSVSQGEEYFRRAVELDPAYAEAYVGIAQALVEQVYIGLRAPADILPEARKAVDKALELNPELGEAYGALGRMELYDKDDAAAERAFKRALDLAPSLASTYRSYGFFLNQTNRPRDALPVYQQGLALDPLSPPLNAEIAEVYFDLGNREEALRGYRRVQEIEPDNPWGYYGIGGLYHRMGRLAEAVIANEQGIDRDPRDPELPSLQAWAYLDMGDLEAAAGALARAEEIDATNQITRMTRALLAHQSGDYKAALEIAEEVLTGEVTGRYGAKPIFLRMLRDEDVRAGKPESALERYEQFYPELFAESPEINRRNLVTAVSVAVTQQRAGQVGSARVLLEGALERMAKSSEQIPERGFVRFRHAIVLSLLDRMGEAQQLLVEIPDSEWIWLWRFVASGAAVEALSSTPAYQAMIARFEQQAEREKQKLSRLRGTESGI